MNKALRDYRRKFGSLDPITLEILAMRIAKLERQMKKALAKARAEHQKISQQST
jgi:hypothetical protein